MLRCKSASSNSGVDVKAMARVQHPGVSDFVATQWQMKRGSIFIKLLECVAKIEHPISIMISSAIESEKWRNLHVCGGGRVPQLHLAQVFLRVLGKRVSQHEQHVRVQPSQRDLLSQQAILVTVAQLLELVRLQRDAALQPQLEQNLLPHP